MVDPRRRRRTRRRLAGDRGGPLPDRLPAEHLAIEQQLQPARQQPAPERRAVTGWINPAAFSAAPAFTFGNAPRTNPDWRGPGQRTTDLAISKTQRFGTKSLSLRIDVLNLFDDPLFIGPVSTFGTSTFGQITSVGGFARSLQFQARLGF